MPSISILILVFGLKNNMYPLISLYFGNSNIINNADMYRGLVLFVIKHINSNIIV